jgi:beta-glucosidase/6-phospho-beta-glucosidase/beta-galactosidase
MIFSTSNFLFTIYCDETVSEHLVSNVRQFVPVHYSIEDVKGAKGNTDEKTGMKVQFLFPRSIYPKALEYIIDNYVKRYGVICYTTEVSVPI